MEALRNLPFIEDITSLGGEIYAVGGVVRDFVMNIESKDLDILIRKVPVDTLVPILKKYGKCDLVGESFGIFKFKAFGSTEDIDIAIPRTERKTGEGHKDFLVNADPELPLVDDLRRRDFTMNAMAIGLDCHIIDPFNGFVDIQAEILRAVDNNAFIDDPLRMLRGIQFAARFDFNFEPKTLELITQNAHLIKNVSSERILIEFEKIAKKGDVLKSFKDLELTGLQDHLHKRTHSFHNLNRVDFHEMNIVDYSKVKTLGEYMYLFYNRVSEVEELFDLEYPNADSNLFKEIKALGQIAVSTTVSAPTIGRMLAYWGIDVYLPAINTEIFIDSHLKYFTNGTYPKSLKEVDCNGHDLIQLGLKGEAIGMMNRTIVNHILTDSLENNKEAILEFVKNNK